MKTALRRMGTALVGAVLITGGVTMTQQAYADTPNAAITNDPNASLGTLAFYDASGNQITSGSINSLQYTYAVASAPKDRPQTTNQKATVFYALPDHTQTDSQNWFSGQVTTSSLYPVTTGPSNITSAGAVTPVNTMKTGDQTLSAFLTTGTMDATAGYQNFVQVRLFDSGIGQTLRTTPFYASVIQIDPTAHTWTQVYPAVVQKTSTSVSTVNPTPASPASHGSSVTLSATVSAADASHPAGSVELFDGSTDVGATTFDAATGSVSKTLTPSDGTHAYKYVFTPADPTTFTGSQSAVLSYTVNPATNTTTTLTASPTGTAELGATVTLNATVSPQAAGTVQFKDGSTNIGSPVTVSSGSANTTTSSLALGSHTLTAVFTSSDIAFKGSTSNAVSYTITAKATSTTLSVSPSSPQTYGTNLTLTGTVSPSNAVGSVKFFDGTTQIGSTQTWSGSSVSVSTAGLNGGSHNLTAQFVPSDPTAFGQSTSAATSYTINPVTTTTTLDPVVATATYGQNTTLSASVSPSAATGSIQFLDGTTPVGSPVALSGGVAGYDAKLTAGSHSITAKYVPSNGNYSTSTSAAQTVTISAAPTTTTLSTTSTTSTFGQSVTVTATINATDADGTVQFTVDGSNNGGAVSLSGGKASATLSGLGAGTHAIGASYLPGASGNYTGSAASTLTVTVAKATTTTTLTTNPASYAGEGTNVTLTVAVSPAQAGTVAFADGATTLGTATVNAGTATFATNALAKGDHSLTATFTPSDTANVNGSASSAVALKVVPATHTTLTAPASTVDFGGLVHLTAAVDPTDATGSVKFVDGSTVLSTVPLTAGSASYDTSSLDSGAHSITAQFVPADPNAFGASASPAMALTVKPQLTTIGVSVVPTSPVVEGDTVVFTAGLTPTSATGSVVFIDNGTTMLGTVPVSAGKATLTTKTLSPGGHSITASFTPTDATKFVASQTTDALAYTVKPKPQLTYCTDGKGHVLTSGATLTVGSTIVLHGKYFVPGEQVAGAFHSVTVKAGTFTAAQDGTLTASVTVPKSLSAGSHTVTLTGANGAVSYAFKVGAKASTNSPEIAQSGNSTGVSGGNGTTDPARAASGISNTGAAVRYPVTVALFLMGLGALFVAFARPRRKGRHAR